MTLTYRDGVSIGEIAVYSIGLLIALLLAFRHGFGRASGWFFLIIFCLARLIGPALQLATINDPRNTSLYTGYAILNNIALSPLLLASLGFLSRLLDNIHLSHRTFLSPMILRLMQLVIVAGVIMGIVGGLGASDDYTKKLKEGLPAKYKPGNLSKASTAVAIVSYAATMLFTLTISFWVPYAEAGEKRLFYAVAVALPFILVRLIYSCIATFTTNPDFNLLGGSTTPLLCMAILMELAVVITFEVMGLTLRRAVIPGHAAAIHLEVDSSASSEPLPNKQENENLALRIAKKTIIGRIVMAVLPKK